jgi:DNA-binding transcriptional regulator YiaG
MGLCNQTSGGKIVPNITNEMISAIRGFIKKTGGSQQDAAYRIGVTLPSLNSWLTGRRIRISPSSVRLIQNFLNEIKNKKSCKIPNPNPGD